MLNVTFLNNANFKWPDFIPFCDSLLGARNVTKAFFNLQAFNKNLLP